MRGRNAGLMARLLIAVLLLASGLLTSLRAADTLISSPPAASALKAKPNEKHAGQNHDKQSRNDKKHRSPDKTPRGSVNRLCLNPAHL